MYFTNRIYSRSRMLSHLLTHIFHYESLSDPTYVKMSQNEAVFVLSVSSSFLYYLNISVDVYIPLSNSVLLRQSKSSSN